MVKRSRWPARGLLLCLLRPFAGTRLCSASDTPLPSYEALWTTLLDRAQKEVTRIRALVGEGTLPKSRLEEAQMRLADAQDEAILARTLYGEVRVEDMSRDEAQSMIEAAQRRVNRQNELVNTRWTLLENGILAKSEFELFQNELDSRKRVLVLTQNRFRLLEDLRHMAEEEQRLERAERLQAPGLQDVMTRYYGTGQFNLADLGTITSAFQKQFHHDLAISALGQTLVHRSMGLDHRNRVDVALNPDQPEGVWLRNLLERLHVPYLAFRSALAGAATAPHIHIGIGSARLKLAQR
jgi:hypothetical protein